MNIVIIGSGNVATVLGRKIKAAGHPVLQVVSRTIDNAKTLADELGCNFADFTGISKLASLYIVAVADSALHNFHTKVSLGNKLVVHTSGAVSKDVLQHVSSSYGVLYPLQSLRMEMPVLPQIPLCIDANENTALLQIREFAESISDTVAHCTDEERLKLHVGAVVVSNFTNHLYAQAQDFCEKEGVEFKKLLPLIEETAVRMRSVPPKDLQTGPAVRNDVFTLDRHLKALANHPKLKYLYIKLTDSIMSK
jgi:predicted short-subunit dehydrogenase-like oxidoreductase (DUF2520 family)